MTKHEVLYGEGGAVGGGASGPNIKPDNLFSDDVVEFILGVSEGPIGGLARGPMSFYLGDTPLVSASGENNFNPFELHVYHGSPNASVVNQSLGGTTSNSSVNLLLAQDIPVIRQTDQSLRGLIDQLEIRIAINALYRNKSNGDQKNYTTRFSLEYRQTGAAEWLPVYDDGIVEIKGKTTSGYIKEFTINVPRVDNDWEIRVVKLSPDNEPKKVDSLTWESFQMVTKEEKSYPNLALVRGLGRASDQFSGLPDISGIYALKAVKVPSNYDVVTRYYDGVWDGTFAEAVTDNPAWVLYDLLINDQYGFRRFFPDLTVDRFSFYEAAKWCDELVPRPDGGYQPRWTYNELVREPRNALEMLYYISGIFGGILVSNLNGSVRLKVDRPDVVSQIIGPESVAVEGFSYQFSDITERVNDLTVSFINPNLGWVSDARRVFDQDLIDANGTIKQRIQAVGCIDVYEAQRRAFKRIVQANTEKVTVTFRMARAGIQLETFDLIGIVDPEMRWGISGRIKSVSGSTIYLRDPVFVPTGVDLTFTVSTPTGPVELTVQSNQPVATELAITSGTLPSNLPEKSQFGITHGTLGLVKPFRILRVKEDEQNPDYIEVSALEHNINKYGDVDNLTSSGSVEYASSAGSQPPAPVIKSVESGDTHALTTPDGVKLSRLYISWDHDPRYFVQEFNVTVHNLSASEITKYTSRGRTHYVSGVVPGDEYEVTVEASNILGKKSVPSSPQTHIVEELVGTVDAPTEAARTEAGLGSVTIYLPKPTIADFSHYLLTFFDANDVIVSEEQVPGTVFVRPIPENDPVTYYTFKQINRLGTAGPASTQITETPLKVTAEKLAPPLAETINTAASVKQDFDDLVGNFEGALDDKFGDIDTAIQTAAQSAQADVDAAVAAKNLAETAKAQAETAANSSQQSSTQAVNAANTAGQHASAAQTSASTAASEASNAAQSASASETAKTEAETAQSNAESARSAAVLAKDSAEDSSAASATYASNSAASSYDATQTAASLFPSDFSQDGAYFTRADEGLNPAPLGASRVTLDPVEGWVAQVEGFDKVNPQGTVPAASGRTYEFRVKVRSVRDNTVVGGNETAVLSVRSMDAQGTGLFYSSLTVPTGESTSCELLESNGWSELVGRYEVPVTGAKLLRPRLYACWQNGGPYGNTLWQVKDYFVKDVTEVVEAEAQAEAASTSASSANTSANDAGNSATAASNAANTAQAKATDATNAASAAQTSASTATAKATEASQSAAAAETSKTQAETARSGAESARNTAVTASDDAESSSATAGSHASNAANSATDAGNAASAAVTSANQAQTYASSAGSYASSASSSATDANASRASAVAARDQAVQAFDSADDARAIAETASETAVSIASQGGAGCFSDQFFPLTGGWLKYGTSSDTEYETNSVYPIGEQVKITVPNAGSGPGVWTDSKRSFWTGPTDMRKVKVRLDITWHSGPVDGAGIIYDWVNTDNSAYRKLARFSDLLNGRTPLPGERVVLEAYLDRGVDTQPNLDFTRIYLMANWASFPGGLTATKSFTIHQAQVYPVTTTEASVQTIEGAVADLEGNAAASLVFRAKAGTGGAELELASASDPTGAAESSARISADNILLDGSVRANSLAVGSGGNLVDDPQFLTGENFGTYTPDLTLRAQTETGLHAPGSSWAGATFPTLRCFQNGSHSSSNINIYLCKVGESQTVGFPVNPGEYYEGSVYASVHRCNAQVIIVWRNENHTYVGETSSAPFGHNPGSETNPDSWSRMFVKGQAPSNAAYGQIIVRKYATNTGPTSYVFIHKPMFAVTHASATEPAPWSPGAQTKITGDQIQVASLSAISATLGTFKSAETGARLEIQGDRLRVYDSNNQVVVKIGFLG